MKAIGINGSQRKGWNTQTLIIKALECAAAAGAETELINLYDQPIKGCLEWFACKLNFPHPLDKALIPCQLGELLLWKPPGFSLGIPD